MAAKLNPYISYNGDARQAFEFYKDVFGGELSMNTFGEFGASESSDADKIMHASLEAPNGFTLMGSDTPAELEFKPGTTMSVSLSGDENDGLREYYDKLAEAGTVTMPLEKQMWGDEFGMVLDPYGVSWMVNIAAPQA
jgi:PhnB protein